MIGFVLHLNVNCCAYKSMDITLFIILEEFY